MHMRRSKSLLKFYQLLGKWVFSLQKRRLWEAGGTNSNLLVPMSRLLRILTQVLYSSVWKAGKKQQACMKIAAFKKNALHHGVGQSLGQVKEVLQHLSLEVLMPNWIKP